MALKWNRALSTGRENSRVKASELEASELKAH